MKTRKSLFITSLTYVAITLTSGCSTIVTQVDGHKDDIFMCHPVKGVSTIYSGTQFNANCIYENHDNIAFFCLIDFPLSLITDTAILPYTIYLELADSGYCIGNKPNNAVKRDK